MIKKILGSLFLGGIGFFLFLQVLPFGRAQRNPPVVQEAPWPSMEAQGIARRACYDCHSNETIWPWYSRFAPMSWLVTRDVLEGREELNFSTWGREEQEVEDISEVIREGKMPPQQYILLHPAARLSDGEVETLLQGLPPGSSAAHDDEDGD